MRKKKGFFKKAFEYGMEKKKKYDEYQTKRLEDLSKRTMKEKEFLNKEINGEENIMNIGEKIKNLRKEQNYTRKELARMCLLNGGSLRQDKLILERIENGKTKPNNKQLWELAKTLDTPQLLEYNIEEINKTIINVII